MPSGAISTSGLRLDQVDFQSSNQNKGLLMSISNSPLESLASFAIVFIAGAISILGLNIYIERIKRDSPRTAADS